MKSYIFRVELEQDDDGRWSAVVPSLPGCASDGETPEQALAAVNEAAALYIEVLLEDGRPVPVDDDASVLEGPAVAVVT